MQNTIVKQKDYVKKREKRKIGRKYTLEEKKYIISAIEDAKSELEMVRTSYNFISDPKLIESLIYKERDIVSRYGHLLQQAKEKGIKVSEDYIYINNCKIY